MKVDIDNQGVPRISICMSPYDLPYLKSHGMILGPHQDWNGKSILEWEPETLTIYKKLNYKLPEEFQA
eukprot:10683588-Ditylum_brightwellii.AAC.2